MKVTGSSPASVIYSSVREVTCGRRLPTVNLGELSDTPLGSEWSRPGLTLKRVQVCREESREAYSDNISREESHTNHTSREAYSDNINISRRESRGAYSDNISINRWIKR